MPMISRAAIEAGARAMRDLTFDALTMDECRDAAECCISAALAAEGVALVPIEPTQSMIDAAGGEYVNLERADDPSYEPAVIWSAMLKAAGASDAGK